jgi:hypothetical protein
MNNPEPSVLDYVKSLLTPWKGKPLQIPSPDQVEDLPILEDMDQIGEVVPLALPREKIIVPWLTLGALFAAIFAQWSLEPRPERSWIPGAILYGAAFILLCLAAVLKEFTLPNLPEGFTEISKFSIRIPFGIASILFSILAFLSFGGNVFNFINVSLWILSLVCFLIATVTKTNDFKISRESFQAITKSVYSIRLTRWSILWIAVFLLSIFFHFFRINQVPSQMISDHAEKLLDVFDVLSGKTSIFFTRNTGREAFQFYLTAAIIQVFNTGISFFSLKLGTTLVTLFSLPFIYLLGKELGNRRIGLIAMTFAGISYWSNIISRIALRFTLYPSFFAPALYFFIRGLRTGKYNNFILSGIFVGIGLHGYTPFRVVPLLLLLATFLYVIHIRSSIPAWNLAIIGLLLVGVSSFILFLPLLRYTLQNPDMVAYRTMTRVGSLEQPLPGPAWQIFLHNLWNALVMFSWDDGEVWVNSVTHRPVLDVITGALFHIGIAAVLINYIKSRRWIDLFLIISIPVLMLPSIFSLAFPSENPCTNRTAGALIPVFLVTGIGLDLIMTTIQNHFRRRGSFLAWSLAAFFLLISSFQNYDLVFSQFPAVFDTSSWNTTQLGKVVREFSDVFGDPESAYVVPFPYWVDTRLVGINAGYPTKDYALWPEQFPQTTQNPNAKMFLLKPEDTKSLDELRSLYPSGQLRLFNSGISGRDFFIYFVPQADFMQ